MELQMNFVFIGENNVDKKQRKILIETLVTVRT